MVALIRMKWVSSVLTHMYSIIQNYMIHKLCRNTVKQLRTKAGCKSDQIEEPSNMNENTNTKYSEEQTARAQLRERFLYLMSNLCRDGQRAHIKMYENTQVSANVKAIDLNFDNVVVENLKTPLPNPIPKAILRTQDIISMEFDIDKDSLLNKT